MKDTVKPDKQVQWTTQLASLTTQNSNTGMGPGIKKELTPVSERPHTGPGSFRPMQRYSGKKQGTGWP